MKRFFICSLSALMCTSIPVYASTYSDVIGHWAENQIKTISEYGLVTGSNGQFRPNDAITRGEMAVILNSLMGYEVKSENNFTDLPEKFYTDAILKANAAGVMYGNNNLVRPEDKITRAEAATMIFRAFDMKNNTSKQFPDDAQIPQWAKDAVSSMAGEGVLSGDNNGNFKPNENITRAEAITIFNQILGNVYNKEGTYSTQTEKDVVINSPNVTLEDTTISGDLYLAPGITNGDVTLNNITVKGHTYIWGGGVQSVHVNNSSLGDVSVARDGGEVRLVANDQSNIGNVQVSTDAILDGKIESATLNSGNLTVRGNVTNLNISNSAKNPQVNVEKNASVQNMQINSTAQVNVEGNVKQVNIQSNASNTSIKGNGKVENVSTTSNNSSNQNNNSNTISISGGGSPSNNNSNSNNSNNNSNNNNNNNNNNTTPISILNVETVRNGQVRVTLNRSTNKPIPLSAFSIICTSGGKDMTILSVSTQDNRIYDLKTTYYDDNTYNLELTLEDGKRVNHDFISKFDCANIQVLSIKRNSNTEATFEYTTDVRGQLFYMLKEVPKTRSIKSTLDAPTAEDIIKNGTKVEMTDQHQKLNLTNLKPETEYEMYYVAKDTQYGYERVTPVKLATIPGKANTPEPGNISITNLDYDFRIDGFDNTAYWFTVTLSEPTKEKLDLSAFNLNCSKGDFSLEKVESTDNKTYTVYLKKGTLPYSNINVTMNITFPDDTVAQETIYFDTDAPIINWDSWEWKSKDTAEVQIRSSESGTLYYKIYDDVPQDTSPKDPKDIFENGTPVSITNGVNYIEVPNVENTTGKYFCFATKDAKGNASLYYTYKEIPEYAPPVQPPVDDPKITSIENIKAISPIGFEMTVNFDKEVTWKTPSTGKIPGDTLNLSGVSTSTARVDFTGNNTSNTFTINFGTKLLAGNHRLTMVLSDGTEVNYDFTTSEDIGRD